jgi:hypothetical protein
MIIGTDEGREDTNDKGATKYVWSIRLHK